MIENQDMTLPTARATAAAQSNIVARFISKLEERDGHWLWRGSLTPEGYGIFYHGQTTTKAHRFSYATFIGKIPQGFVIDHICRVRNCVNPLHLRAVTRAVNALENSVSPCAENAARTHCANGHELSGSNLAVRPTGQRRCRACARDRWHLNGHAEKRKNRRAGASK